MKRKPILFLVVILVVVSAMLAKDLIIKAILERTVEVVSGLKISIGSTDVGIFNTSIRVKDLVIYNPPSFKDRVMANINELYINYDIRSGFKREIRIRDMIFDVGRVNVIKNSAGDNNLNSLKIVKALEKIDKCDKPNGTMPKLRIDSLHLKGGKVTYKDYTKMPYPLITEFEVRVDERYENITNPYELVSLIVSRSLVRTSPLNIIGFDLAPLQNQVKDAMSKSVEAIKNFIHAD